VVGWLTGWGGDNCVFSFYQNDTKKNGKSSKTIVPGRYHHFFSRNLQDIPKYAK